MMNIWRETQMKKWLALLCAVLLPALALGGGDAGAAHGLYPGHVPIRRIIPKTAYEDEPSP